MQYPERFTALLGYPFPRLRALLQDIPAGGEPVRLSLGEPQHEFPEFAVEALVKSQNLFNNYPKNNGAPELLDAISGYVSRRFHVDLSHENITPLNGTREGLYTSALALLPESKNGKAPLLLAPNPFYQVYMMGARTLGIETRFMDCTKATDYLPDLDDVTAEDWARCVGFFICSPSNPQGAIADRAYYEKLLGLAEKHDFIVFSDECYAEIYFEDAPVSAVEVSNKMGVDLNRVLAFHSLSKRSNMPGLRSGFVMSGEQTTKQIQALRGYAGAPIPGPIQMASAALWNDDAHVATNRALYTEKMSDVTEILGAQYRPQGGFFLWLPTQDGEDAARQLWATHGIEVLPGGYLSAPSVNGNPGENYIRVAMVAPRAQTKSALISIKETIKFE